MREIEGGWEGWGGGGLEAMRAESCAETSSLVKERDLAIFQLCNWDMSAVGSGKRPVG